MGREGQSTWNVLRRLGTYEALDIADLKAPAALPEDGTVWHTGPDYQKCMDDYDVVFKSPGIVLERPENEYRCSILSQTEVFFPVFPGSDYRNHRNQGQEYGHDPSVSSA